MLSEQALLAPSESSAGQRCIEGPTMDAVDAGVVISDTLALLSLRSCWHCNSNASNCSSFRANLAAYCFSPRAVRSRHVCKVARFMSIIAFISALSLTFASIITSQLSCKISTDEEGRRDGAAEAARLRERSRRDLAR